MKKTLSRRATKDRLSIVLLVCVLLALWLPISDVFRSFASPSDLFSGGVGRFQTDYNSKEEALAATNALNKEIMAEGAVMLKNDGLLPLARNSKVSLLGNPAAFIVAGGAGSGAMTQERINNPASNIYDNWFDAFAWDGGFDMNAATRTFYESTASGPNASANSSISGAFTLNLASDSNPFALPSDSMITGYNGESDVGIVFLSRMGAEVVRGSNGELPRVAADTGNDSRDRHWLALHHREEQLLEWANASFNNVIVVINSSNVLEVGFLNDTETYPNIKAAFHVGQPGTQGIYGFPQLLREDGITPSGRMVDTLSKDFTQDPVFQNVATNDGAGGTNVYYVNGTSQDRTLVEYEEGIYLGYRYWETRGYDEFLKDGNWNWYEEHVNYPYGYGLSYTTFDWEIVRSTSRLSKNGNLSIQVKVTNTGSKAGKDVVQMYYTAPYNRGGIEKSHVNLGGFAKTRMLRAGESDIVTLEMPVRTMASWDYADANRNGIKGAYEMEIGKYMVSVARDAHDAAVMASTPDENPLRVDYDLSQSWIYETDETTGTEYQNLFEESNQYVLGDDHEDGDLYGIGKQMTVMSREDFEGTFPTTRTAEQSVTADFITSLGGATAPNSGIDAAILNDTSENPGILAEKYRDLGKPYYRTEMPAMGEDNGLTASDMIGLDYDDPKWEEYMDQWTSDDFRAIMANNSGNYRTMAVARQGLPTSDLTDGPLGFTGGGTSVDATGTYVSDGVQNGVAGRAWRRMSGIPGAPLQAQTFNVELAYRLGRAVGNEALWGTGDSSQVISGWYGPAMNIHRSPFSGRNFEYYSEDGMMSGIIASNVVLGASEKGLVSYLKHFALNDQETSRTSIATWAEEQTMREIYFKPFEMAVKKGRTTAVMASMNRIGTTYATNDYRLITQLLRDEWGFRGHVSTDYGVGSGNIMQRAGTATPMAIASGVPSAISGEFNTPTHAWALREAAKGVAYTVVNSNRMQYETTEGTGSERISNSLIRTGNEEAGSNTVSNRKIIYKTIGSLPAAEVGTEYVSTVKGAYTADMVGTGVGFPTREQASTTWWQSAEVSYAVTGGTLPGGLTLNADSGIIEGTPTAGGTFTFTVTASAGTGSQFESASQEVQLFVESSDSSMFEYTPYALEEGVVTGDYEASVEALNTTGDPYDGVTYALDENSQPLPAGLTLSSDGIISGTAQASGTVTVTVRGTRQKAGTDAYSTTAAFTLTINALPTISYDSATATIGKVGQSYSAGYEARVSDTTYTLSYALAEGSDPLPDGLELSDDGEITGIPGESGKFTFSITASGRKGTVSLVPVTREFTVIIFEEEAAFRPTFYMPNGVVGTSYSPYLVDVDIANSEFELSELGATYAIIDGALPAGLSLEASTGLISGTPMATGTFNFTVTVTADIIDPITTTGTIVVLPGAITYITDSALEAATANTQFIREIRATNGANASLTFTVKAGSALPEGVIMETILDDNSNVVGVEISGSLAAGTYTFTLVAEGAGLEAAEREFTIVVNGQNDGEGETDKGCGSIIGTTSGAIAFAGIGATLLAVLVLALKKKSVKKD